MNAMQQLEAMGYRFRLDGERVRYTLYGGEPPREAEELLRSLDRDFVRDILRARERGCITVKPQLVHVPWEERYRYLCAIKAALITGELLSVRVTFVRSTRACVYELTPPGVDFMKYDPLKGVAHGQAEGLQGQRVPETLPCPPS